MKTEDGETERRTEAVETLTSENFDERNSSGKAVVNFYANWCVPCSRFLPDYEEITRRTDGAYFAKVDLGANGDETYFASRYNLRHVPTIIMFEDGKETGRYSGTSIEELSSLVNDFVKGGNK